MRPHEMSGAGQWTADADPGDARSLRQTLGCFATGVAIVTTLSPEGRYVGLTINSFSSVSMAPPLVLWSLADHSPSRAAFEASPHFAINILAADQADLCKVFATPLADKFAAATVEVNAEGIPLLAGAVAQLECERVAIHDGGDHRILVGRVLRHRRSERVPLIFVQGGMGVLATQPPLKRAS